MTKSDPFKSKTVESKRGFRRRSRNFRPTGCRTALIKVAANEQGDIGARLLGFGLDDSLGQYEPVVTKGLDTWLKQKTMTSDYQTSESDQSLIDHKDPPPMLQRTQRRHFSFQTSESDANVETGSC